jgi:hypothetical protein
VESDAFAPPYLYCERGKLNDDEDAAKKPSDTHGSAQLSNEQHNSSIFSTNPETKLIGNGSLHLFKNEL